jgi:hypothetical protein
MGSANNSEPIYMPGGRLFGVTSENVDGSALPQFRDEYERSETGQPFTMNLDGTGRTLGARNVSHKGITGTLLSDGRLLTAEWDHLGGNNSASLRTMNQDLTGTREAYGREGTGLTNSYLRPREITPGHLVVIGLPRDRTYQAGQILSVNLGGADISQQAEIAASGVNLTPDVPGDRTPSFPGVGRYYDAYPVGAPADQRFLVSWADGPVESEVLSMAHTQPDFGIYLYDAKAKTRTPIANGVGTWETSALPLIKRAEPPMLPSTAPTIQEGSSTSTLIASINVYDSTQFQLTPGTVQMVRITEGFSSEEGFPNDFGLTEFDGQARLGEIPLLPGGAFKALVPANTPPLPRWCPPIRPCTCS